MTTRLLLGLSGVLWLLLALVVLVLGDALAGELRHRLAADIALPWLTSALTLPVLGVDAAAHGALAEPARGFCYWAFRVVLFGAPIAALVIAWHREEPRKALTHSLLLWSIALPLEGIVIGLVIAGALLPFASL